MWQSPTSNEPAHLASGVALWELGRFDVYRVNPPLIRAIAAIPVMMNGCKTHWNNLRYGPQVRSEFAIGADFVKVNRLDSVHLFNLARLACLPFSILGAWCCYLWGRALCGSLSGFLSCVLWCFSPNILAAGQVICPDMGGASLGLVASYTFWRWLKALSWESAALCGATFGLALLARSSWIVLFGLWPSIWFVVFLLQIQKNGVSTSLRSQIGQMTLLFGVSLYVLNLGYLFDGTLMRLGDFEFVSQRLGNPQPDARSGNVFKDGHFAFIPVPLPKEFVLGLDQQKKDFEAFPHASYLRGEWRMSGWWYYYLYGFLVKVPASILCLVLISICVSFQKLPRIELDHVAGWMSLCLPGLATVVILSCQPSLNHHFRYALPAFGPLFVFAGSIPFTIRRWKQNLRLAVIALTMTCVVSLITTTLTTAPRFISFFNLVAGGARQGHRHMIHSSLDWGQDLYFLKEWLQQQQIDQPIHLAYHGVFDPADIGIDHVPARCGPHWMTSASPDETSDLWVISVNYLVGDRWRLSPNCHYEEFLRKTPIHVCGDSLYVYKIPHDRRE
ncbi:ArnT family glycosyltransferase [Schlesneria paludicola]|uniref:ArnT family glycosyltransferase n=1 Tax=Schlesneria paludicola TaxID=360056 RepID=UPI00029A0320|nr:hypothetical protein [Schlesneria paludicola]